MRRVAELGSLVDMKAFIFFAVCAGVVLCATWEMPMHVMSMTPSVTASALVIGILLIVVGCIRGERLALESIRNVIPLIIAGLVSLVLVTLLRGVDHLGIVIVAGIVCVGTSIALVVVEKPRRFLAAGYQVIQLLYMWGLTPYWIMGVRDDRL
jgi:hypothetical protein